MIFHLRNNFSWTERLCLHLKIFILLCSVKTCLHALFFMAAWQPGSTNFFFLHLQVYLFHQHSVTLNFQPSIWMMLTVHWHLIHKKLCHWRSAAHHGDLPGSSVVEYLTCWKPLRELSEEEACRQKLQQT